ncbi:MAG TPA: hypothetical protein VJK09_02510 [Candidatus Paceibacterota bacterium]
MKFFIPLGLKYGNYWHLGNVYGPYEDDKTVEEEIARLCPNSKTDQFLIFDGYVINVKPSPKEKPESEKREPGNMENYVKKGDVWKCRDCDADILGSKVAHPIWIRGFAGGSGECEYETVPYCPNCEKKPNFNGAPVDDD